VRDHGEAGAYMSQKLGVSAIVWTSDRRIVALKRSSKVAESKGKIDCPGGHPEPGKIGLSRMVTFQNQGRCCNSRTEQHLQEHHTCKRNTRIKNRGDDSQDDNEKQYMDDKANEGRGHSNSPPQMIQEEECYYGSKGTDSDSTDEREGRRCKRKSSAAVVSELFQSVIDEVVAETGIRHDYLSRPVLLGIVRQLNSAGCPSASFLVQCSASSKEIKTWYNTGVEEQYESTKILFYSIEEVLGEIRGGALLDDDDEGEMCCGSLATADGLESSSNGVCCELYHRHHQQQLGRTGSEAAEVLFTPSFEGSVFLALKHIQ